MDQTLIEVFALDKKDIRRIFRKYKDIKKAVGVSASTMLDKIREAMYVNATRLALMEEYEAYIKQMESQLSEDETKNLVIYSVIERLQFDMNLMDITNPFPVEFIAFYNMYVDVVNNVIPEGQEIL